MKILKFLLVLGTLGASSASAANVMLNGAILLNDTMEQVDLVPVPTATSVASIQAGLWSFTEVGVIITGGLMPDNITPAQITRLDDIHVDFSKNGSPVATISGNGSLFGFVDPHNGVVFTAYDSSNTPIVLAGSVNQILPAGVVKIVASGFNPAAAVGAGLNLINDGDHIDGVFTATATIGGSSSTSTSSIVGTAVPEPNTSLALLAAGMVLVHGRKRRC